MESSFKKDWKKLKFSTDTDMLLMIEKWIREGICHATYRNVNAINKYMKDSDENKESSYLWYFNVNNLYG